LEVYLRRLEGKGNFYLSMSSAATAAVSFFIDQSFASVICAIVLGIVISPYWSLLTTIVQESVPEENISTATGIAQTIGLLGSAVGPVISGALILVLGISYALLLSVVLPSILCGLIMLL